MIRERFVAEDGQSLRQQLAVTVSRTRFGIQTALRRRDSQLVFVGVTGVYLVAYLVAVGHLSLGGRGIDLLVVTDPLSRAFEPIGYGEFEPVARLELPVATYLFSPVNTVVGLGLAGLVGINLALTYLAWRQPQACGLASSSTGAFAGLPALLSGAACCGPVVLIILGIQASGVILTAFNALLPIAAVLLVGSLLWVGRKIDPSTV